MFVIPAIDILGGRCVRLVQGDFGQATRYDNDPVAVAKRFEAAGARRLHVIDLDGAARRSRANRQTILAIAKTVGVPVQVGGGIRTYAAAKNYLENGVAEILVSTMAIKNPRLLKRLIREFGPERVGVAVDIKNGRFAIDGWAKTDRRSVAGSLDMLKDLGVQNVLVTDVSRDGRLAGPNFTLAGRFIDAGFRTTAAGGVTALADIVEFNKLGAYGVIAGKAVYEGRLDIGEVTAAAAYRSNLTKRIIPCLDMKNGRVVKGVGFKDLCDAGDAVALGQKYAENGADELVFLDIAATLEGRRTLRELTRRVAAAIDIPFTVGGGIRGLEDIRQLLLAGADKVSIGSAAVTRTDLVGRAAGYFGSQCIVVSADAKRRGDGWEIYVKSGTEATGLDAVDFCRRMAAQGAGEILVNSLDRDGRGGGFDLELLRAVVEAVDIPVIASSGAGSARDFLDVFERTGVDAALGASIFHFGGQTPDKLKCFLADKGVRVRL